MFPILHPGSLLWIDEGSAVSRGGWTNEFGLFIFWNIAVGLCAGGASVEGGRLLVQVHASDKPPAIFQFHEEINVVGQVVRVAMFLEQEKLNGAGDPQVTS
jgi:hypothetical protein